MQLAVEPFLSTEKAVALLYYKAARSATWEAPTTQLQ